MFVDLLVALTLGIVIGFAVIAVLACRKPDHFHVQRDTLIRARPSSIFPYLDDFHLGQAWSPFEKKDPDMARRFFGAESGTGAGYAWSGDNRVGEGQIVVTASVPDSKVVLQLDMVRPIKASNVVEYRLEPHGAETRMIWSMHGKQPFMARVMTLFIDCDGMLQREFDQGLAGLKRIVEVEASPLREQALG